ncbi:RPOM protein, partial [Crypturellus undulatus]|nr:RPOM protein [Crypturellus undulatus]
GIPWSILRNYSASTKEKAIGNVAYERTELLEVLKARVKQLQTSNVPEVTVNKAELAPLEEEKCRVRGQRTAAPGPAEEQSAPKGKDERPARPRSWVEKLRKEMYVKQLKAEQEVSTQLAEKQTKAKTKSKTKTKSNESLKAVATPTWNQSPAGLSPACAPKLSKPRTTEVEDAKKRRPRRMPVDKESQYKMIEQTILSNLECFQFLQQPEKAEKLLLTYHKSAAKRKILTVAAYNIVMRSWAKKGCLTRIDRLLLKLRCIGLRPNLDSYAIELECMGRNGSSDRAIRSCVERLKNDGFRVDELFQKCLFEEDEKEMVLRAIRMILPDYELPPPPNTETCKSSLLQNFYSKERNVSYPKLDFTVRELRERFQKQLELEMSNTITIKSVEAMKPVTPQATKARELLAGLRSQWHDSILQALQKSKHEMSKASMSGPKALYPYLCLLPDEEYVSIMMEVINTLSPQGVSLVFLARELGSKIYNRYITHRKMRSRHLEKVQKVYEDYIHLLAKDSQPGNYLPREYWEKLVAETGFGPSLSLKDCSWPYVLHMRLGMHLLELLVQSVKVPRNILNPRLESKLIPVLYHIYTFRNSWQVGLVKPHPILCQIMADASETTLTFNSCVIPMLCPPVPWTSSHFGAYVLNDTRLMRYVDGAVQHQLLLDQCPQVNLHPVLDALNQLGNCAWKINQPVLDIIISIFNDKGDEKLDIPPPISEAPKPPPGPSNPSLLNKAQKHELMLCKKKAAEMHSLRMDSLYKLSIANHVRDKVFWFPHNMDFRGRTYPCPPYFNHLGNDVTRAILLFAEGRPLGPKGLDWLKIHLINLTGLKKKNSLQERLEYANEIMEDILDSADHPLTVR